MGSYKWGYKSPSMGYNYSYKWGYKSPNMGYNYS